MVEVRAGSRAWAGAAAVAALVTVLAGCSSDGTGPAAEATSTTASVARRDGTSPLAVDAPSGWTLVAAGRGQLEQEWGSDTVETRSPYTVVARTGEGPASDLRVSVASPWDLFSIAWDPTDGYDGVEVPGLQRTEVGGDPAWIGTDRLAVVRGPDLVLEVDGRATEAELRAVARASTPRPDHVEAPTVGALPDGLEVVGHVDATALAAIGTVASGGGLVPGDPASHSLGWRRGPHADGAGLVALTVPGGSVDLDALARVRDVVDVGAVRETVATEVQVDGRAGLLVEHTVTHTDGEVVAEARTILVPAPWGDVLVVGTQRLDGDAALEVDQLLAVAASARAADAATWTDLVAEAGGGPELAPDPGRTELLRGEVDGTGWLLQTGDPGPVPFGGEEDDLDGSELPDPCLKLDDGRQTCAATTFVGPHGELRTGYEVGDGPGPSVVVSTAGPADVRLTAADGSVRSALLQPVPGGRSWVGLFHGDVGEPSCEAPAAGTARVEAIDAEGVTSCLAGR